MTVTITPAGITALIAALGFFSGAALFAVNALIARQLRALNGRYIYSMGAKLTGHEIQNSLDRIERHLGLIRHEGAV